MGRIDEHVNDELGEALIMTRRWWVSRECWRVLSLLFDLERSSNSCSHARRSRQRDRSSIVSAIVRDPKRLTKRVHLLRLYDTLFMLFAFTYGGWHSKFMLACSSCNFIRTCYCTETFHVRQRHTFRDDLNLCWSCNLWMKRLFLKYVSIRKIIFVTLQMMS